MIVSERGRQVRHSIFRAEFLSRYHFWAVWAFAQGLVPRSFLQNVGAVALGFIVWLITASDRLNEPIFGRSWSATSEPSCRPWPEAVSDVVRQIDLQAICDEVQRNEQLPGLWLAVHRAEGPTEVVAAGVKKIHARPAAEPDDLIHIGSCTKAMTAVLIGRLVEQGHLRWTQTIAESFPALREQIVPHYQDVTLESLLQHRGRVPANPPNWWLDAQRPIGERRLSILSNSLRLEPEPLPRDGFRYSNLGYLVAGAMAEQATGKTWETLIAEEVFQPLHMTSARFGPPGTPGKVDQPWGHIRSQKNQWKPVQGDNAPALGPAGTVHLKLADWFKFSELFYEGLPNPLISVETQRKLLQVASPNGYAMGWGVFLKGEQISGLQHSGSNTMWLATIHIDCQNRQTRIAATNCYREGMDAVLDACLNRIQELK